MNPPASERMPWYRIPVAWVCIGALLASVIGCVINVVIALRLSDTALVEVAPESRFGLTIEQSDSAARTGRRDPANRPQE